MTTGALDRAFQATTYRVETPDGRFDLRIGVLNPAFDACLRDQGVSRWGIVTPCNPGAQRFSEAENQVRQTQFLARIEALGWRYFAACNLPDSTDWPPEVGCCLLQVDTPVLCRLAAEFGQLAWVSGDTGLAPRLVWR